MTEPESVWRVGCELGEGPCWDVRDQALWFVDIKGRCIHRFDPATGDRRSWDAPEQVGFVLPARDGGFIAGLQSGLYRFDPVGGGFTLLAKVEPEHPGNRLNDGVVDAAGRIWFGTMDDGERATTGCFFRFERSRLSATGLPRVCITNGPAVAPDGRTLYHVDTLGGAVHVFDLADDGSLGPSRPFVRIAREDGYPDGPTVDAEGCVWIGLYGGWEARRYSPAGELIDRVRFPTANITKVAFGGADLRTLYATSARKNFTSAELAAQPEAGGLFAVRRDTPGVASPLAIL